MSRWMLGLSVAGIAILGSVQAGGYGYGSCYDSCCQSSCDCCCDPCYQPYGNQCCSSGLDDCCCGGFEVIGEYLYIRPHMCDLNYVISDERAFGDVTTDALAPVDAYLPSGDEHGICPNYSSAFRVGLGYLFNCGCSDITVTYTRLYTRNHSHTKIEGDGGLWITYGHPRYNNLRLNNANLIDLGVVTVNPLSGEEGAGIAADANLKTRVEYNMVDGVLGKRSLKGCDLYLRSYVGLRWADICLRKDADYAGTVTEPNNSVIDSSEPPEILAARLFSNQNTFVQSKSDTWGIGPRVGADLRYAIACGFGIGAHVGVSILVGEATHHIDQGVTRTAVAAATDVDPSELPISVLGTPDINEEMHIRNKSRCHLFPELDARLGLNYMFCCGDCFSLLVEAGWEFVSYVNAIGRIRFNDVAGTSREVCESFNLDGLYVAFVLGF